MQWPGPHQLVAECATSDPRFGRQNAPPTKSISQPLREPGLSYLNDPAQVNGPGPASHLLFYPSPADAERTGAT
jgi:hypothetical protein